MRNNKNNSSLHAASPHTLPRRHALAALAASLFALPATAADISVNGTTCTLVEAINNANSDTNGGGNGCAAGSGADTLMLTADQTLSTVDNTTFGPTGLPLITSDITIQGNGHSITRVSADPFRILAVRETGNLTLQQTTVSGGLLTEQSSQLGQGAGIDNFGALTLVNSTVSGNTTAYVGGGICNAVGTLILSNSTVTGNRAASGGGIFSFTFGQYYTAIINSTISGNSASLRGGGVQNNNGLTVIRNSTITQNTAPNSGLAGVVSGPYNSAFTKVAASIISGNDGSDVALFFSAGINSFTSLGDNLIGDGDATGAFVVAGDQTGVTAPGLQALADNGGSTLTHALNPTSPAVDAVTGTCPAPATDQRGVSRPQGAACDIGAFELEVDNSTDLSILKSVSAAAVNVGDPLSYTLTVKNSGPDAASMVDVADSLPAGLSYVSATPGTGTCSFASPTVSCSLGALALDQEVSITIAVTAASVGTFTNTASVIGGEADIDPDAANNSASVEVSIEANPCAAFTPTRTCTVNGVRNQMCLGTGGNDVIVGGNGRNVILGGQGNDTLSGGNSDDLICGGGGNDTLRGNNGNDTLLGSSGDDRLIGDSGNDSLNGGLGTDRAEGGKGTDTCTAESRTVCEL